MRILAVLVALQTAAIAALLMKIDALEDSVTAISLAQSSDLIIEAAGERTVENPSTAVQLDTHLIQSELRGIVRDELAAAHAAYFPAQYPQRERAEPESEHGGGEKAREYQQQLEIVSGDIDYYVSEGSISEAEMAALQIQLAKLDLSGRKQMMRKLLDALNSGDLAGRL
jgi:hypothetical protein